MAELGERLGGGGSSEVYAWDDGQVVKLFLAAYEFAVDREHDVARAVHDAGVASPAVHGVVDVDGRRGIVFERVDGPTLLDQLLRSERSPAEVGAELAGVHLAIHTAAVPGLPDLAAVLRARGRTVPAGDVVFRADRGRRPGAVAGAGGRHPAPPGAWQRGRRRPDRAGRQAARRRGRAGAPAPARPRLTPGSLTLPRWRSPLTRSCWRACRTRPGWPG